MNIPLIILVLYAVLMILLTWAGSRLTASAKKGGSVLNYMLAGRNLPTVLVATMVTGLAVGGASTVGVAEHAYTAGFSAGWYNGAWALGALVAGLFLTRYFRRMNVRTIPEMMGIAYGPRVRVLSTVIQLLIMMTITALQYVAAGAILTTLLPDVFSFTGGMVASAALFILVTLAGGYWASGLSNFVNVIVIYLGIIVALIASVHNYGGLEAIMASLAALPNSPGGAGVAGWLSPVKGIGWGILLGWLVTLSQVSTIQGVGQISLAARDESTASWGFIIGAVLIFPAGFLCALFGIIAASQHPGLEQAAMALPMVATHISPWVGGLFLASLWAADVSTAIVLLMGSSSLLLEDVWKKLMPRAIPEEKEMAYSRLSVLVVSLVSFGLALTVVGMLKTLTSGLALTTPFMILLLVNIYLPGISKKAAGGWTLAAGLITWILWTYVPGAQVGPHLIYAQWVVCGSTFLIATALGKEPAHRLLPEQASASHCCGKGDCTKDAAAGTI